MTFRVETIGDATLYLGDCREVMASWPECFRVDAVVTDPPYGINHARNRNSQKDGWRDYPGAGWDQERPERPLCEFAWSSQRKAARIFDYPRGRALLEGKEHPTQKPVELMEWCLGFLPNARTILDPFAGSGSTGVACVKAGLQFIGIEREPKYFDIACRRIDEAYKQPRLFAEPTPKPTQSTLSLEPSP